jgi:hypothetical protein
MPLNDFYKGTTKKFDIVITYNNTVPNITTDEIKFYLKDNKDDTIYALTASADVSSSGSIGVAKFSLTPEMTDLNPENYFYEIVWNISTGDKYVLDSNSIKIIERI